MGSLKSGLCAIALASLVGTAAVVGCSADGGGADVGGGTPDPTLPNPDDTNKLPPSNSSGGPTAPDAGKDSGKDSGPKPDATVDAGPPPPVEGTACPTLNAIAKKPCGACGTAATVCLDDGTGKGVWSTYGVCGGELAGGCVPGTSVSQACGNCGTQTKSCNQYCAYTTTACAGEPVNNCKSGAIEYSTAGCATPSTYRNRTCGATCTWSGFSATCAAPVNDIVLNIGAAVGATTSTPITFSTAKMGPQISPFGTCPLATAPTAGDYPYQYVEVHNPSATKAAKVTIYTSAGPSAVVIDTIMAAYANAIQPMDDPGREACTWGVDDQSSSDTALTGNADFSILKTVPIPAGGSILVYAAAYYEWTAANVDVTTGDIQLNVKIEQLN